MSQITPSKHTRLSRWPPSRLCENSPPRAWKTTEKTPNIKDLATFARVHRQRDDRLKNYLETPKRNYRTLKSDVWSDLLNRNARNLAALNCEARIAFAVVALRNMHRFNIAARGPFQWVTFAPKAFVFPLSQAHKFNPKPLMAIVRQSLGNISAIGMIEAALFKNWGPNGPSAEDHVSFHVHLEIWGASRGTLQPFAKQLIDRHTNMFGRSPVWIEPIGPEQLESKMLYALKGQTKEYRVYRKPGLQTDPRTGELHWKIRQTKRDMRTGDHLSMVEVFDNIFLDQLIFGNAEGTQLARAIRFEAMRPFCTWAQPFNRAAELYGREVPYPLVETYRAIGTKLVRDLHLHNDRRFA